MSKVPPSALIDGLARVCDAEAVRSGLLGDLSKTVVTHERNRARRKVQDSR
jgi:hypothetical protein